MSTKAKSTRKTTTLEKIVFIGLLAVLFLAPLFRGLYFESELFIAHIVSFILTIVWIGYNFKDKRYRLFKTPVGLLAMGVVFMYFISIFYGVNERQAIAELLKYMNYFAIFVLARDLINTNKKKNIVFNVLVSSGVLVSIIGIGTAIGTWNYNGAFNGSRIFSTLQYPNALASFLGALFILALGMILSEDNKIIKSIYSIEATILLFTFVLTYSRGMWLLFPIMMLLYFVFTPKNRKIETILYTGIYSIVAVPSSFIFIKYIEQSNIKSWGILVGAMALSFIITYGLSHINSKLRNISIKKIYIGVGIIGVIFIGMIVFAFNSTEELNMSNTTEEKEYSRVIRDIGDIKPNEEYNLSVKYTGNNNSDTKQTIGRIRVYSLDENEELERLKFEELNEDSEKLNMNINTIDSTKGLRIYFENFKPKTSIVYKNAELFGEENKLIKDIKLKYKFIPEKIVSRINSISVKERNAQGRLSFYNDAFKIVKDYPILGTGGGGWETLYQSYQSYSYWTTQAHNYFLQLWIEVGLVGLVLFISMILALIYYTFKVYRSRENHDILLISTTVAVLSILTHSVMDFDLSLPAISFVLWVLIGMISRDIYDEYDFSSIVKKIKIDNIYTKSIYTVTLIVVLAITISFNMAKSYAKEGIQANKAGNLTESISNFEKAEKFDWTKPEYKADLANLYKGRYRQTRDPKDIQKSLKLIEELTDISKYNSKFTQIASSFYMSIGEIDKGLSLADKSLKLHRMDIKSYLNKSKAHLAAFDYYMKKNQIKKAEEIIKEAYNIKEEINKTNEIAYRPLDYNEDLLWDIGYIQFYKENLKNAQYDLSNGKLHFAYYFDMDMNDDGNIDILKTWNSKEGNIKYNLQKNKIRITNSGKSYGIVYPYNVKLEPNTKYTVYFKAKGTVNDAFNFYVYDNNASNKAQAVKKNIELNKEWEIYKVEFTTDKDVEPGSQYLRFQHNGSDDGYIDIEEAVIFESSKGN